jgi:hypothetical protein
MSPFLNMTSEHLEPSHTKQGLMWYSLGNTGLQDKVKRETPKETQVIGRLL